MSDETNTTDFDFTKVKVKVEKKTPPRVVSTEESHEASVGSPADEANKEADDQKVPLEPIKSSNEILAELFKVFNAAPPPSLLDDEFLLKKSKKHKKDKKHHKKKSKKRGRSSSDDRQSEENSENSKKKHKKRKHKKSKKHDLSEIEVEVEVDKDKVQIKKERIEVNIKKEQIHVRKASDESDFIISDVEEGEVVNDKETVLCRTLDSSASKSEKSVRKHDEKKSSSVKSGKIVIKSLKDSNVLKEADKAKRDIERERTSWYYHDRDGSSELSLSDEETYLKEKCERYYKKRGSSRLGGRLGRERFKDSSKDRFSRRNWREGRSRSRSKNRRRSRSRSRSRRDDDFVIDKKRLLEIARKNAISMFKSGSLPGTQSLTQEVKDKVLMKMRYGGKTVEELTEFCKKLTKGESLNDLSSVSSNEDSDHDRDGNEKAFHHPFVLKDRGPIVMNIKNATPIPPKTAEQTKAILMQYPVSSGQQHRLNESEWVPVPPKPAESAVAKLPVQSSKNVFEKPLPVEKQRPAFKTTQATQPLVPVDIPANVNSTPLPPVVNLPPVNMPPPIAMPPALPPTAPLAMLPPPVDHMSMMPPPVPMRVMPPQNLLQTVPSSAPVIQMPGGHHSHMPTGPPLMAESVFPQSDQNIDVASIITKRLNAMRKLQDNPTDPEALKMMYNSQKDMSAWVSSKFTPGQFTGSTGANVLTARELTGGHQAWVKRDQLTSTVPLSGGMGMHLLQKMGWRPGEGLGKEKNGSLHPLLLEFKLDKRGLVASEEDPALRGKRRRGPIAKMQQMPIIENKHPVSLLGELCAKRKWGAPAYELVNESEPAHNRNFIFKVILNGVMYQPAIPCNSKKEAKALAAKYCLQQLGILPP